MSSPSPDKLTKLLALLPTGTYLAFSTLVPITTDNGDCGFTEILVTGLLVGFFGSICAFCSFTDSFSTADGQLWYGIVTRTGLWNPFFGSSGLENVRGWTYVGEGSKFTIKISDVYIALLSVVSFLTLSLLSKDFTDCFYKDIPSTILKSIPIPVNFLIGIMFAFAPPARHTVGFAFSTPNSTSPSGKDFCPDQEIQQSDMLASVPRECVDSFTWSLDRNLSGRSTRLLIPGEQQSGRA